MIFVNLIYRHFDILMPQYGHAKKIVRFRAVPKWCYTQLHTVRTGIPDTPQTRLSASSFHEYPSDTPRQPPNTPPDISRELKISTDDNRWQQRPTDTLRHWQVLFEYVWRCLLAHFVVCWHLDFPGDVWGLLRGCLCGVWGVSEWYSVKWRRPDVFKG